ncbi:hypothetical protein ITJ64_12375 [Herbiconiux sp. VKM Ac-1786]|uniref:hypothetical protein n=1 Tax=Herbiconiux sp. VKM Ac-1786 TaxID=2783824 RepID=UPI00188D6175|nr:hypothetical protein [Herbiconiux sp. VKM Ac-1786]MBF4573313.1 hypothetical protein [Herbiconiux sp. VKM Ac-1786]
MSGGDAVHLVLVGRTLRGTLGEEFRAEALALVGATADAASAISRTVELTAVAVSSVGAVRVGASIADPAFPGGGAGAEPVREGWQRFVVAVDEVAGIRPLVGPPGVDLARTVTVDVAAPDGVWPGLEVHVVERG